MNVFFYTILCVLRLSLSLVFRFTSITWYLPRTWGNNRPRTSPYGWTLQKLSLPLRITSRLSSAPKNYFQSPDAHQNRFRPGLCPRPRWRSSQWSPCPNSVMTPLPIHTSASSTTRSLHFRLATPSHYCKSWLRPCCDRLMKYINETCQLYSAL